MSGFKTHFIGGVVAGTVTASYYAIVRPETLNPTQLTAVFICGTIGGLLPDLDSDTGKPLSMLFGLISVIIPVVFLKDMSNFFDITPEFLISYFVLTYFLINYVLMEGVKRITRHRGIMHSIPFALLCGEASFFMFMPSGIPMATAAGIAVFIGAMVHLILDEFHSIVWKMGCIPIIKNSIGTALKLKSNSLAATVMIYMFVGMGGVQILRTLGFMTKW